MIPALEKKRLRNKPYYEKNKQRIKEHNNEYKNKMTPFEKSRERVVQKLNADPEYHKRMKSGTMEKYKLIFDDNTKRWKWEEDDISV